MDAWKTLFRPVNFSKFKSVPRPAATPSAGFLVALAGLLALLHAVLAVTATAQKSMTSDEIAHLTAGQAYNTLNDYRLQPENGNLPQRLAALPLTLEGVALPAGNLGSWQTADVWNYGHSFFYENGLPADEWLFLGRSMIALVSAATGLLVFFWSRALFGWRGAFLSLTLFVFSPTFLAHGALTTSDVVMTFFFLASVGAWWRHLERPGVGGATLSAVVLGLAFVSKFSVGLLPPMLALTALVWAIGQARIQGWRVPLTRLGRTTLVHALVAWAIIWLFYGFRASAFAPTLAEGATFNHGWGSLLSDMGWPAKVIWHLNNWHVLPESWLYGLTFVIQFSKARGAFMNGEYSVTGWTSFFPFAFLVKTTLPFLLLTAIASVAAVRAGWPRTKERVRLVLARLRPLTPLAALFLVYWATSLASHLNIGHRHILPTYPVLFIAVGWLGPWLDWRRPLAAMLVAGLASWHMTESMRVRPHYLAYFNQLSGGPKNGWRHLVDSSLDWGQDLPSLKTWLDEHAHGEKVYLAYFGTGDPAYEGIKATALPTLPDVGPPRSWHALGAGIYAVSATMLQQVYGPVRGDWTLAFEKEYQELRALEPAFLAYQNDPARRAALLRDLPAERWAAGWKRYELLRFARLCYCLRARTAEANVGYSILVYRLDAAEIAAATTGSLRDWQALIEREVTQRQPTR